MNPSPADFNSPLEALRQLKALLDQGAITAAEFDTLKQRVLNTGLPTAAPGNPAPAVPAAPAEAFPPKAAFEPATVPAASDTNELPSLLDMFQQVPAGSPAPGAAAAPALSVPMSEVRGPVPPLAAPRLVPVAPVVVAPVPTAPPTAPTGFSPALAVPAPNSSAAPPAARPPADFLPPKTAAPVVIPVAIEPYPELIPAAASKPTPAAPDPLDTPAAKRPFDELLATLGTPAAPPIRPPVLPAQSPVRPTYEPEPSAPNRTLPKVLLALGALALLLVLGYLFLNHDQTDEHLTSLSKTAADSVVVSPDAGPSAEPLNLPSAGAVSAAEAAPAMPPLHAGADPRARLWGATARFYYRDDPALASVQSQLAQTIDDSSLPAFSQSLEAAARIERRARLGQNHVPSFQRAFQDVQSRNIGPADLSALIESIRTKLEGNPTRMADPTRKQRLAALIAQLSQAASETPATTETFPSAPVPDAATTTPAAASSASKPEAAEPKSTFPAGEPAATIATAGTAASTPAPATGKPAAVPTTTRPEPATSADATGPATAPEDGDDEATTRARQALASYYADLQAPPFNAAQHFAPTVERLYTRQNLTPATIEQELNQSIFPEFKQLSTRIVPGTLRLGPPAADGTRTATYTEQSRAFRVSKNQHQRTRTQVRVRFDPDFKMTYMRQEKLLENTFEQ